MVDPQFERCGGSLLMAAARRRHHTLQVTTSHGLVTPWRGRVILRFFFSFFFHLLCEISTRGPGQFGPPSHRLSGRRTARPSLREAVRVSPFNQRRRDGSVSISAMMSRLHPPDADTFEDVGSIERRDGCG